MYDFIAQLFGIVGMLLAMFSFQCKNNKRFFVIQVLSGIMFAINFVMLGVITSAIINVINVDSMLKIIYFCIKSMKL